MYLHKTVRKIIVGILLIANSAPMVMAALAPKPAGQQSIGYIKPSSVYSVNSSDAAAIPKNLSLSSQQLGITGPLTAGVDYSNLTGAYFNAQFLKILSDTLGFNILGEYGDKQYRLNGTIGFLLAARTFFKISAEQLGQTLPFYFNTGNVEKRVSQNAVGLRVQRHFAQGFLDNLSLGTYAAKTPNNRLAPIAFVSNGSNCNGYSAGFLCLNERNIAGSNASGADIGLSSFLTPSTYLEGKLYYDSLRYNTIFS